MDEEHLPMPENLNETTTDAAAAVEFTEPAAPPAEAAGVTAEAPEEAPAAPAVKAEEAPAPKADEEEDGVRFADLGIDGRVLAALQDVGY